MSIPCEEKRTLFNLLNIYDCHQCEKYRKEESYKIGEVSFNIYYIKKGCSKIIYQDIDLLFSKRLKLFLKDAIIYQNKIVVVWLDEFDINKDTYILYDLLSFEEDVHLICD